MPGSKLAKILVGFDGSDQSRRAFLAAREIAEKSGGELIVIEVVGIPVYLGSGEPAVPLSELSEYVEVARKAARVEIDKLVAKARADGIRASGEVLRKEKSTAKSVLDYAEDKRVDLIIVGTRGMGGFKKLLLGSVSSGLVSHAHCSVLVVR